MPLVNIKEAVPVKVAEYAKANKIDTEPAFAWWVPYTLKNGTISLNSLRININSVYVRFFL